MKILFLDGRECRIRGPRRGELLRRALLHKLRWDFLLDDSDVFWTRLAGAMEPASASEVVTRARLFARGLSQRHLTTAAEAVQAMRRLRPDVVYIGAHGDSKRAAWCHSDGAGVEVVEVAELALCMQAEGVDPSRMTLVTDACSFGLSPTIEALRRIGFACVVAWPGDVCVTEALTFDLDFFESLAFQHLLAQEDDPLAAGPDGKPVGVVAAYEFAVDSLRQRYRLLERRFRRRGEKRGAAGYYLHTPGWKGPAGGYAELPGLY